MITDHGRGVRHASWSWLAGLIRRGGAGPPGPLPSCGAAAARSSSAVLLAYPAWFALAGPAHLSGSIWGNGAILSYGGNGLGSSSTRWPRSAKVDRAGPPVRWVPGTRPCPVSISGGACWPSWSSGCVIWHRDLRLWLFAAVGTVCAFLSLGLSAPRVDAVAPGGPPPQMDNVIPSRFGLVVYLCAAVMLGHRDWTTSTSWAGSRTRRGAAPLGPGGGGLASPAWRRGGCRGPGADRLLLRRRPAPDHRAGRAARVVPDRGSGAAGPPGPRGVPPPFAFRQSNMTWQAVDRMSYAMAGGGGPGSIAQRAGAERAGEVYLGMIGFSLSATPVYPPDVASVRSAVDGWGVTTIVLPDPAGLPSYARVYPVRSIAVLMTAVMGGPPTYTAGAWVWSGVDHAGPPLVRTAGQLAACTGGIRRARRRRSTPRPAAPRRAVDWGATGRQSPACPARGGLQLGEPCGFRRSGCRRGSAAECGGWTCKTGL